MKAWVERNNNRQINVDLIRPVLRAYALGYLSSTAPRLLGLLATSRRRDVTIRERLRLCARTLGISAQIDRFPASCAIIVGGATLLPGIVTAILDYLRRSLSRGSGSIQDVCPRLIRLICTLLSSMLAFQLLNRDDGWVCKRAAPRSSISIQGTSESPRKPGALPIHPQPRLAGRTMDLTLFAFTRAISVLSLRFWARTRTSSKHHTPHTSRITESLTKLVDPAVFSVSAALVMHSWLYSPQQLPQTYNKWIQKAANIDPRILQTLRLAYSHEWGYGIDNEKVNHLMRDVARDLSLPEEWGDPTITVPLKCELIHSGCGPSCELYALWRFWRAWLLGMEMYLPLQLALRMLRNPSLDSLLQSITGAARSSAFLGSFLFLFYYGICLSRSRIGPLLYSQSSAITNTTYNQSDSDSDSNGNGNSNGKRQSGITITPQSIDSGLCIQTACTLCGWSILVESPARRAEVAMFVAPRALATLLPRVYDRSYIWREAVVFAGSVTVVLDAVVSGDSNGELVRGVLGRVLGGVMTA